MKRAHLFTVACGMIIACADEPTVSWGMLVEGNNPVVPVPSTDALSGRIIVSGIGADRIVELRDDHGDVFRLIGIETIALANVGGGDAVVWGTWDANPGFVVQKFKVTGMHGRPALDGVLEASDAGFTLRLNDGSHHVVPGLALACEAYLGDRIWMVGFEDGGDMQFGVIAGATRILIEGTE
jgi:hypothetical protein